MEARKPLAKISAEKFEPLTVKMPPSLRARFTEAALAEGQPNVSAFVRDLAIDGLEYRQLRRGLGAYRGRPGMPDLGAGPTAERTVG